MILPVEYEAVKAVCASLGSIKSVTLEHKTGRKVVIKWDDDKRVVLTFTVATGPGTGPGTGAKA